jgi:hypothetical protein
MAILLFTKMEFLKVNEKVREERKGEEAKKERKRKIASGCCNRGKGVDGILE